MNVPNSDVLNMSPSEFPLSLPVKLSDLTPAMYAALSKYEDSGTESESSEQLDPCGTASTDVASVEQPTQVWIRYSATIKFSTSLPLTDLEIDSYRNWLVGHRNIRLADYIIEKDNTPDRHIQSHFEISQNSDANRAHNLQKQIIRHMPNRPESTCSNSEKGFSTGYCVNHVKEHTQSRMEMIGYDLKDLKIPEVNWSTLPEKNHRVYGLVDTDECRAFFMGNVFNDLYLQTCKLAWENSESNKKRQAKKRKFGEVFLNKNNWTRQIHNYLEDEKLNKEKIEQILSKSQHFKFSEQEISDMDSCSRVLVLMIPDMRVEFGMLAPKSRSHIASMRMDNVYPKAKIQKLIKPNGSFFN